MISRPRPSDQPVTATREGQDAHRQAGHQVQRVLAEAPEPVLATCSRTTSSARRGPSAMGLSSLHGCGPPRQGGQDPRPRVARVPRRTARRRSSRGAIVAAAALRIALGDFTWRDAVAAVGDAASSIPSASGRSTSTCCTSSRFASAAGASSSPTAKAHREHHERPNHLGLILLAPLEAAALLLLAVPVVLAVFSIFLPLRGADQRGVRRLRADRRLRVDALPDPHRLPPALSAPTGRSGATTACITSRTSTTGTASRTRVADHVLRTAPDQKDVPRSRTARTLQSL